MHPICLTCLIFICASSSIYGLTKVQCEPNDEVCIHEAFKTLYYSVNTGNTDTKIDSSDPLYRDVIQANLPNYNYTLSDAYMYGMKDCVLQELKLDLKELTSYYYLICPKLTLKANYVAKGEILSAYLEGEGKCSIIFDEYHIGLLGKMDTHSGAEGKCYTKIKSFELTVLDVRSGASFDFQNLFYGDLEKSKSAHKLLHDNWKQAIEFTQKPLMYSFIGKLVENINSYLKVTSIYKTC